MYKTVRLEFMQACKRKTRRPQRIVYQPMYVTVDQADIHFGCTDYFQVKGSILGITRYYTLILYKERAVFWDNDSEPSLFSCYIDHVTTVNF